MMNKFRKSLLYILIVFTFGLVPSAICQLFTKEPVDRYIHIRNFRYGKEPSVIRCNRGDRLHLTFSSDDTGHSFFLEEFDMDVKVSPSNDEVAVFKASDPTTTPVFAKEVTIIAKHPGIQNYIIAKSNFRCHTWCGPLHAFEQGKLVIFPNTLLVFSLGCLIGILVIWISGIKKGLIINTGSEGYKDLFKKPGFIEKLVKSRWPQVILIIFAMLMIYIAILTSSLGTKVSGRNLGVLMMWAVWLFLLVAILTPLGGRIWCTICPLPFFGDLLQRRSVFSPEKGQTKGYRNKFYGLFLKWPEFLNNNWLKLILFMVLATFSTTLVAVPKVSGITVLMLMIVPTLMAPIWEGRAFCRYVCPISVFVGSYSGVSALAVRNKSQSLCDQCRTHYCEKGSSRGWACPYGINVGEMKENMDCGLCMECTRSCMYNNVSLYKRPFNTETGTRNYADAFMAIALFTIGIAYSIVYQGHWTVIRDYIDIIDKHNWDLFGIYSLVLWSAVLILVPAIFFLLAAAAKKLTGNRMTVNETFTSYAGALLPSGLMLWIAFVIPMLFVNKTFIEQSASDPFGWGWDFFGTASIPWHQFLPQYIPWFQAILLLLGLFMSLRNITKKIAASENGTTGLLKACLPFAIFMTAASAAMIFFFTN